MSLLYELTGTVAADDGSSYEPHYIGGETDTRAVLAALKAGCRQRGDSWDITVRDPDGYVMIRSGSAGRKDKAA